ncbi:MAG: fibronectin type III domain-containing protein [Candidatus Hydrogenedentota bacterium]
MSNGDSIGIIYYGRHSAAKPGINDITPGVTTANPGYPHSDWADENSRIDASKVACYVIQESILSAFHRPADEPVTGKGIMRDPLNPTGADNVDILAAISPPSYTSTLYLHYTTNNWASSDTITLSSSFTSGSYEYFAGIIPKHSSKGDTVKYYLRIPGEFMHNYIYGNDNSSTVTTSQSTAQNNAFYYVIKNSVPSVPSVDLAPHTPQDSSTLVATASGSTDADTVDTVYYVFHWYRNGTYLSSLTTTDSTSPYTSFVSCDNTFLGDDWYFEVIVTDNFDSQSPVMSNIIRISNLETWDTSEPSETNSAIVINNEWIFRDKKNDQRTIPPEPENFDILEARIKMDTMYFYIRVKFQDITNINYPNLAISIDTNNSGGGTVLGDESQTGLGNGYYLSNAYFEKLIVLHNYIDNVPIIEIYDGSNWVEGSFQDTLIINSSANVLEARIRRDEIGLSGDSSVRLAIAVFKNRLGKASEINSTVEYPTCDALDNLGITALGFYDNDWSKDAYDGEVADGDVDFWFWFRYDANGLINNDTPTKPANPQPADSDSTADKTPTLSWDPSTDPDAQDTITSYLIELGEDMNLDRTIKYRVNLENDSLSFTVPDELSIDKWYYWRVRARDQTGRLSSGDVWSFKVIKPEIYVTQPLDKNNIDNYLQVQGQETRDSNINWYWSPPIHSVGWQIKDIVIQVSDNQSFTSYVIWDTLYGSAENGCTNSYTITSPSLQSLLERGNTYYARIKAGDTATPQNWSDWSTASDGVYYSLKQIDGNLGDWQADTGWSLNSANYIGDTFYEGIWQDSTNDQRTDRSPQYLYLDLDELHIAADKYNLYFYIKMTNWSASYNIYLQLALDINNNSSTRVFKGRDVEGEDCFTSSEACWEYLVRCLSGNNVVYINNKDWGLVGLGRYTENSTNSCVEIAVPLDKVGGSNEYYNDTMNLSVAVFWCDNGSVGDWDAGSAYTVNAVDVVSGENGTWSEVSDKVVEYYLQVRFDTANFVSGISIKEGADESAPTQPSNDGSPLSSFQSYIFYNVFVDRFWNGYANNTPSDPDMTGGDFDGFIEKMQYFNDRGITGLYCSPILDFGGGTWGYNQHDLHRVQGSFVSDNWTPYYGWDDFVTLVKEAQRHNIKVGIDWVPGQIYGNETSGGTIERHPKFYHGERFGGRRILQYVSDVRQFFVDHSRFLYGLGCSFFRVDNPKFYPDPLEQGLPFFVYTRKYWDTFAPDLYTFGEVPGGVADCAAFCKDGNRLHGMLDFPLSQPVKDWCQGGNSGTFRNTLDSNEAGYVGAVTPLNVGYYENHDHDRCYHYVGDNADAKWNMQSLFLFLSTYISPPCIFYGDERVMMGKKNMTYPGWQYTESTSLFGNTRAFAWDYDGATSDIDGTVKNTMRARNIFECLTYDSSGRYYERADGTGMIVRRGAWDKKNVVCLLNNTSSSQTYSNFYTWNTSTQFRDWFNALNGNDGRVWSDANAMISSFTVNSKYAAFLVKESFDLAWLDIHVKDASTLANISGAIVSIDSKSAWTAETNSNGDAQIYDIWTEDGATTSRTLKVWAPGYMILEISMTFDGANLGQQENDTTVYLTQDNGIAPAAPTGLSAVPRDKGVELNWTANTEDDFESYYIYRSQTSNDQNPTLVVEVLRNTFFESNFDRGLTNGDTYYYKVKARDINDNVSGFSNEVMVVPHKVQVTFQVDMSNSGFSNITQVYMKGNPIDISRSDFNESYKMSDIDPLVALTYIGRNIWEKTIELDPTMTINWIYVCNYNNGSSWYDEYNTGSNGLRTSTYENARETKILDSVNWSMPMVRVWMNGYDVAPQKPIGLSAVAKDRNIKLGWSLNLEADMDYYEIWKSTDGVNFSLLTYADEDVINYTDYNVTNGAAYWYKIKAVDVNGYASDFSDSVSSSPTTLTDTTPPSVPQNLEAAPAGTGRVKITWDYNTEGDLAGYNIYRSTATYFTLTSDNKINTAIIPVSLTPNFTDQGLSPGQQYYYVVTTLDDALNESDSSSLLSVKLSRLTFRVDVGNVSPLNVKIISNNIDFIGSNPGQDMTKVTGTNSTYSYTTDFIVGNSLQYKYTYNSLQTVEGDFSTGSKYRELTVPDDVSRTYIDDWEELPTKVTGFSGTADSGSVWLMWSANTANEDFAGYNLYRETQGGYTKINSSLITNTYYQVTGLTNGTTYYFTVRAVDSGDIEYESINSDILALTPNNSMYVIFKN